MAPPPSSTSPAPTTAHDCQAVAGSSAARSLSQRVRDHDCTAGLGRLSYRDVPRPPLNRVGRGARHRDHVDPHEAPHPSAPHNASDRGTGAHCSLRPRASITCSRVGSAGSGVASTTAEGAVVGKLVGKSKPEQRAQPSTKPGPDLRRYRSRRPDSNREPPVYKTGALPIAPRRRCPTRVEHPAAPAACWPLARPRAMMRGDAGTSVPRGGGWRSHARRGVHSSIGSVRAVAGRVRIVGGRHCRPVG